MSDPSDAWLRQQMQTRGGQQVNAHNMADDPNNLGKVTDKVREHMDNAGAEAQGKKYGQQKWGLFETNYQRNKGISTEQSLREIEEFAKHNPSYPHGEVAAGAGGAGGGPPAHPPPQPGAAGAGGAGAGGAGFGGAGGAGFGGAGGGAFHEGGGGASGFSGGRFGGQGGGAGSGGALGAAKFGPGAGQGDAFFAQYKEKEAAKYKPRGDFFKQ